MMYVQLHAKSKEVLVEIHKHEAFGGFSTIKFSCEPHEFTIFSDAGEGFATFRKNIAEAFGLVEREAIAAEAKL